MRYRNPPSIGWLPIAIHVALTVIVIAVGVKLLPLWHRQSMIARLTDPRLAQRERALNYLMRHARDHPRVRSAAIGRLREADDSNFLQIANALDHTGCWRRTTATNGPWLRWLEMLCRDESAAARTHAAGLIGNMEDLSGHDRVGRMLTGLLADQDDAVRYEALVTTGRLAALGGNPTFFEALLVQATGDTEPQIARNAWIMLGLLQPHNSLVADWRQRDPLVAEAQLWAISAANTDRLDAVIDLIGDPQAPAALRATAVSCLAFYPGLRAGAVIAQLVEAYADTPTPLGRLLAWRGVLATAGATILAGPADSRLSGSLARLAGGLEATPWTDPVVLAALYRGLLPVEPLLVAVSPAGEPAWQFQPLALLAVLEGLAVDQHRIPVGPDTPVMLRLAALAVTQDPDPDDLRILFLSDESAIRDLACVVAKERFTEAQQSALVASLLADFNDNAKCSGAVLAGLTGLQGGLLTRKARDEDVWSVQQVMTLGLWMQGGIPQMDRRVSGLVTRDDMPRTTVLLAMLHRGQSQALAYLFNPEHPLDLDVVELLDEFRWWRVLKHYLPDSAPPFWIWADGQLQQFQLELLENWYILHGAKPRR